MIEQISFYATTVVIGVIIGYILPDAGIAFTTSAVIARNFS